MYGGVRVIRVILVMHALAHWHSHSHTVTHTHTHTHTQGGTDSDVPDKVTNTVTLLSIL